MVLVVLLAAIVALPVASALDLTPVGGFRMFTEPLEYRLEVELRHGDGRLRVLRPRELAPHLGPDARRHLLGGRTKVGETHVVLLAAALDDVARLACALDPEAVDARAVLLVRDLHGDVREDEHTLRCARAAP